LKDPRNLFEITPDWLDFRMLDPGRSEVYEGAEFDYNIKWLGIPIRWKSRIIHYHPPVTFTDTQVAGPYRSWEHLHVFEETDGGTLMKDTVTYRLPLAAFLIHRLVIMKQLREIFLYRALRIDEWGRMQCPLAEAVMHIRKLNAKDEKTQPVFLMHIIHKCSTNRPGTKRDRVCERILLPIFPQYVCLR